MKKPELGCEDRSVERLVAIVAVLGGCRINFDPIEDTADQDAADQASVAGSRLPGGWGSKDLTAEGQLDWRHWGYNLTLARNEKVGADLISDYTIIGAGAELPADGTSDPVSWTDGTPVASASGVIAYVLLDTPRISGDGFRVDVAADPVSRRVRFYLGNWCTRARLAATLDDGVTPPWVDTSWEIPTSDSENSVYVIDFRADAPGRTLSVSFTVDFNYCTTSDLGEVKLMAVTLQ